MKTFKIIKANDPERYIFTNYDYQIICQIEEDDLISIVKSKITKSAKSKADVLYEGNIDDFNSEMKTMEYGIYDTELAFQRFINNYLNNLSIKQAS